MEASQFVRESVSSRSLDRGLALLRAFKPGSATLTTTDLADRTGLPIATVSRLLATLVRTGFLTYDFEARGYALGMPLLSLGHAYSEGSTLLAVAAPLMSDLAQSQRVNVGLAGEDVGEIVYLQSVRGNPGMALRRILPGTRAPLELTAIGRAWLSAVPAVQRAAALAPIAERYGTRWAAMEAQLDDSMSEIKRYGYCTSRWQAGVVGIARPLRACKGQVYGVNVTFLESARAPAFLREQGEKLIDLVERIERAMSVRHQR